MRARESWADLFISFGIFPISELLCDEVKVTRDASIKGNEKGGCSCCSSAYRYLCGWRTSRYLSFPVSPTSVVRLISRFLLPSDVCPVVQTTNENFFPNCDTISGFLYGPCAMVLDHCLSPSLMRPQNTTARRRPAHLRIRTRGGGPS